MSVKTNRSTTQQAVTQDSNDRYQAQPLCSTEITSFTSHPLHKPEMVTMITH